MDEEIAIDAVENVAVRTRMTIYKDIATGHCPYRLGKLCRPT